MQHRKSLKWIDAAGESTDLISSWWSSTVSWPGTISTPKVISLQLRAAPRSHDAASVALS